MKSYTKESYRIIAEEGFNEFRRQATWFLLRKLPMEERLRLLVATKKLRRAAIGDVVSTPLSYIRIDPQEIEYVTPVSSHTDVNRSDAESVKECIFDIPYGYFRPERSFGRIVPSKWDRREVKFEECFIYRSINQRFNHGCSWEETPYLDRVQEFLDHRERYKGYDTLSDFKQHRLPYLDDLYHQIEQGNYRRQIDMNSGSVFNELTVNVGRDGEVFFNSGGAHRLSMAKVAGVESISALVVVRKDQNSKPGQPVLENQLSSV